MLTLEQIHHFEDVVKRAKLIILRPIDGKQTESEIRYHMRVSGRQMPCGAWVVGLIFGKGRESDWLKIAEFPEEKMVEVKREYRGMLKQLMHVK
ncbi:hypothetical protein MF451_003744 [Salmonella enterica subsp. enterica serovar Saintpaul]|nr:hypothetical protein [Salmonella enterica subsp. enterica serovar Saintpaul]